MVRCVAYIHDLCMTFNLWPLYQNYIFTMNLSLTRSSLLFNICIPNCGIYMCVSPDNMLCTFLTFVWPLTYMWVWGVSLVFFVITYPRFRVKEKYTFLFSTKFSNTNHAGIFTFVYKHCKNRLLRKKLKAVSKENSLESIH